MKTLFLAPVLLLAVAGCYQPVPDVVLPGADAGSLDAGAPQPDAGPADAGPIAAPDAGLDAGIVDPGIISTEMGSGFEAEPSVAGGVDGTRVVAWLDYPHAVGRYQIAYSVSHDFGRTFGSVQAAATPDGWWGRSPVVSAGPDGIWLAWPAIHLSGQARDDVRIVASHLAFGADTFDAPVVLDDKTMQVRYGPSIAVLTTGALVAAYLDSTGVTVSHRDASGAVTQASLDEQNIPSLCTNGTRVYATVLTQGGVALHWSDDEGHTWPLTQSKVVGNVPDLSTAQPTCAAVGDTVWVLFGTSHDDAALSTGAPQLLDEVLLTCSKDAALTFSTPVDIKPTVMPYAMLPNVASAGPEVFVGFYSGSSGNDGFGSAVIVRATDALDTFSYAHAPMLFSQVRTPPRWAGDALGLSVTGTRVDLAYAVVGTASTHVGVWGIEGAALGK